MVPWLYAVAYRYGVAATGAMDYPTLQFWHEGHLSLLEEEREEAKRIRNAVKR